MLNGKAPKVQRAPGLGLRFQDGDISALEEIVELYALRLKGFCRVILGSAEIAEEVVQEVFLKAWECRGQLRNPERLEPWLFTLARSRSLRVAQAAGHRKERNREPFDYEHSSAFDGSQDARDAYLGEESARLLQEALATLDPKKRDLLSLRYFSDLTFAEIAEVLDMPIGSVGTLLNRALGRLRNHFQDLGLNKDDLLS